MLGSAPLTTMLPVVDLDRARHFYQDSLGLTPIGNTADGKFEFQCGGATLALFPRPGGTKAEHTAVSFRVHDIAAEIARLVMALNATDFSVAIIVALATAAGAAAATAVAAAGRANAIQTLQAQTNR